MYTDVKIKLFNFAPYCIVDPRHDPKALITRAVLHVAVMWNPMDVEAF